MAAGHNACMPRSWRRSAAERSLGGWPGWLRCMVLMAIVLVVAACRFVEGDVCLANEETEGPWRLAYRFREGETLRMAVRHRAVSDTTIAGTTQSVETATDSTKVWKVLPGADGTVTLEHSVEDVRMHSRTSDRGSVSWDSRDDDQPPPGYEHLPGSLHVPLSRITIDDTGHVLDRRNLRPVAESNTGDLVIVPLPDEPAGIGTEWEVPDEFVVEVPGGPRRLVRTRLRYRLASVDDGIATIHVDTTVLTPIDDPQLEARLLERIWDGMIRFDIDQGRVVERATEMDRRVIGFSGPQSSLRYRAELEERLLR
jgi:hypothetical protein